MFQPARDERREEKRRAEKKSWEISATSSFQVWKSVLDIFLELIFQNLQKFLTQLLLDLVDLEGFSVNLKISVCDVMLDSDNHSVWSFKHHESFRFDVISSQYTILLWFSWMIVFSWTYLSKYSKISQFLFDLVDLEGFLVNLRINVCDLMLDSDNHSFLTSQTSWKLQFRSDVMWCLLKIPYC